MTLIRISGPAAALQFTVLGPELYDAVPPSHAGGASRIGPSDADGPQAEGSTSSDSDRGILTPDSSDTGSVVDSALSLLANLDPSSSSDSDPSLDSADSSINGRRYIRHAVRLLSVDDDSNGAAVHPQGVWPEWDLSSDEGQITACRDVFLYALSDATMVRDYGDSLLGLMAGSNSGHGRQSGVLPTDYLEKADKDALSIMETVSRWLAEIDAHRNKWSVAV